MKNYLASASLGLVAAGFVLGMASSEMIHAQVAGYTTKQI